MGDRTFSRSAYAKATTTFAADAGPVTRRAEQKARETGELNPLVDPKGFGVIRRSLPRLEQRPNGLWRLTVGIPMPIETRVDTTGSMGGNVDVAFRVLPHMYESCQAVLPGYDLQIATGIFGDVGDNFVLCRPQFEMEAEKIVEQLTLMVPERSGGDAPEDPHYGIFGAAYLTAAHICRLGLRGYDFTVSDETAHSGLDERQLIRIFGDEVFAKAAENGHQVNRRGLPSTAEMVADLLARTHAFFLQVESRQETTRFWAEIFGRERVVMLPSTELLPQVQAAIIGLTEGTLDLQTVEGFLRRGNVPKCEAEVIRRSVANIPIGAQAALPNFGERPKKGDLFREKADIWPVDPSEVGQDEAGSAEEAAAGGPTWL